MYGGAKLGDAVRVRYEVDGREIDLPLGEYCDLILKHNSRLLIFLEEDLSRYFGKKVKVRGDVYKEILTVEKMIRRIKEDLVVNEGGK
jgi:hypothetical protein